LVVTAERAKPKLRGGVPRDCLLRRARAHSTGQRRRVEWLHWPCAQKSGPEPAIHQRANCAQGEELEANGVRRGARFWKGSRAPRPRKGILSVSDSTATRALVELRARAS
jgi:hypothetical protein